MPRLSDLPEPYAIVVMLPGTPPATATANGRIARMIAWLLDHRAQVEAMRGSVAFNFGDRGFQAEIKETFPYQPTAASTMTDDTPALPPEAPTVEDLTKG